MLDQIKKLLLGLPEIERWPEMVEAVAAGRKSSQGTALWEYPVLACRAVGGNEQQAVPGMAAIAALVIGIHQIDDMLDQEPGGIHHRWGWGRTANIAAAFHMAALRVISRSDLPPHSAAPILDSLAGAGIHTAWGQHLDTDGAADEASYWRSVDTKTPPLIGSGLFIGALLGGASLETAGDLYDLGLPLGRMIQVGDDLDDAFETPARADWRSRVNNLPILYAMTADHPHKDRFCQLLPNIEDPSALAEAQQILISSGAMSYCCYHTMGSYKNLVNRYRAIDLPADNELDGFVRDRIEPLKNLFASLDLEFPEAFIT